MLPHFAELEPGKNGPVRRRYLWATHFASAPRGFALYFSGLEAHARASVNGHVVSDFGAPADARLPRSIDRVVLIPVADEFWRVGDIRIELDVAGPHRRFERILLVVVASGPPALYAALRFGVLDQATDFWRLGLIVIVGITVWAIGRAAVQKRSIDSFLMALGRLAVLAARHNFPYCYIM
jgi:hypothetical protein